MARRSLSSSSVGCRETLGLELESCTVSVAAAESAGAGEDGSRRDTVTPPEGVVETEMGTQEEGAEEGAQEGATPQEAHQGLEPESAGERSSGVRQAPHVSASIACPLSR
jgi:hypothetical protein